MTMMYLTPRAHIYDRKYDAVEVSAEFTPHTSGHHNNMLYQYIMYLFGMHITMYQGMSQDFLPA
jgi:hypothetical protein